MRKALLFLNFLMIVVFGVIFGMGYFMVTHPFISIGIAILGLNLILFTLFKVI